MNPIVHGELSWLLAQALPARRDRALVTLAGLLPDLDGLTLVAGEELYGRWHHVLTHGAMAAVGCAVLLAMVASQPFRVGGLALVAFHLHLLCDLAGSGPGWPIHYLWPWSMVETSWSGQWNLASWQNSVIGLGATLACLSGALWARRTPVELFSLRGDERVVATLRRRFARAPSVTAGEP